MTKCNTMQGIWNPVAEFEK